MKVTLLTTLFFCFFSIKCWGQTKLDSCRACGGSDIFCYDIINNNDCNKDHFFYLNKYYRLKNLNNKKPLEWYLGLYKHLNTIYESTMISADFYDTIVKTKDIENVTYQILKELRNYSKVKYAHININTNWERESSANEIFDSVVNELHYNDNLQYLHIQTSGEISNSIHEIKNLKKLELILINENSRNRILKFPRKLNDNLSLKSLLLDLHYCSGISDDLYSNNSIEELDMKFYLNSNKYLNISIPDGISKLTELKKININGITKLPVDLGGLFNLERISFSGNIQTIPESWKKLRLVEYIDVSGCTELDSNSYINLLSTPNLKNIKMNVEGIKYLYNPIENCRFKSIELHGKSIDLNNLKFIKSINSISLDTNSTLTDISIINVLNISKIKIHDVPIDIALNNLQNDNFTVEELLIDNISFLLLNKQIIKKLKGLKSIIVFDEHKNHLNGSTINSARINWKEAEAEIKKQKNKHHTKYSYLKMMTINRIQKANKNINISFTSSNI